MSSAFNNLLHGKFVLVSTASISTTDKIKYHIPVEETVTDTTGVWATRIQGKEKKFFVVVRQSQVNDKIDDHIEVKIFARYHRCLKNFGFEDRCFDQQGVHMKDCDDVHHMCGHTKKFFFAYQDEEQTLKGKDPTVKDIPCPAKWQAYASSMGNGYYVATLYGSVSEMKHLQWTLGQIAHLTEWGKLRNVWMGQVPPTYVFPGCEKVFWDRFGRQHIDMIVENPRFD